MKKKETVFRVAVNGHSISSQPIGLTHVTSVRSFCYRGSILRSFRETANAPKNGMLPSLSVWKNSVPTGRIFMEFDTRIFFENLSKKFIFD